jgi:hypothetical protein
MEHSNTTSDGHGDPDEEQGQNQQYCIGQEASVTDCMKSLLEEPGPRPFTRMMKASIILIHLQISCDFPFSRCLIGGN